MTEYRDYLLSEQWDMEFTGWDDFREARDERVIFQNLVIDAASQLRPYVGRTVTVTDLSRIANRLEQKYEQQEYVDSVEIVEFGYDDGELQLDVVINSEEISGSRIQIA